MMACATASTNRMEDGAYQHDGIYPAVHQCHERTGDFDMILFRDGRLLEHFTLKFVAGVDSGPITYLPEWAARWNVISTLEFIRMMQDHPCSRLVTVDKLLYCQLDK